MVTYGLTVSDSDKKVPLKDITVHVDIKGFIANVENRLRYRNDEAIPIEAIFVFPLDEQSAIYKFEALIEGRLIVGECQDKAQAQQTYQDAIDAGESAFLLEESDASGDVFECLVGNIPAQTEVDITFSYAIELGIQHDGSVKFVYPAVLGSRYGSPVESTASSTAVSAKRTSGPGRTRTSKGPLLTHAPKESLTYTFNFTADIATTNGLSLVKLEDGYTSPGHYNYKQDKKDKKLWHLEILAERYMYQFDHDIIMYITEEEAFKPKVIVGAGESSKEGILKKDVAMVNFCPKLDESDDSTTQGEFIFVVDRSGSMGGDRIQSAKEALGKFLDILPDDCYFNIISFGSHFDSVFKNGSRRNSPANMKQARGIQSKLDASYGGTEMVAPFKHMYTWKHINGYQRQVFVLTDGCIWNTPELIKLVKRNAGNTRVFTFGIGHGASTALVKGVARAGGGKAEFITNDVKALPEKVAYILSKAQQPFVSDVTLKWKAPGKTVSVVSLPQHIPPIFFGEKLIVYGVITVPESCKSPQKCSVVLEGKLGAKKLNYSLDFTAGSVRGKRGASMQDDPMSIHRLAAKAQIKELEDEDGEKHKATIVMLSTSANIVSKYTAFVGVDHGRPEKVTGAMESRVVPLAELEDKKTKKRGKAAGPAPAPAVQPGFYGGGSSDCPLVDKYINGKSVSAIPDAKDSDPLCEAGTSGSVLRDCDQDEAMDTSEADSAPEDVRSEAAAVATDSLKREADDDNASEQGAQPGKKNAKFTHVKQHKPYIPLAHLKYAPWTDGCYYPVEKATPICRKGRTRPMSHVKFCDGMSRVVPTDNIVMASRFSAGDEVLAKIAPNKYRFSLVLEYCADDDGLIVASKEGYVSRFQAHYLALPKETAMKLKSREKSSFEEVTLCTVPLPDKWGVQEVSITTSDLAELNLEGWINKAIVHMYLAHKWNTELPDDVRETVSFISPMFYHTLSQELNEKKKLTRKSENETRYNRCRVWSEAVMDIHRKDWLFIPIFDEIHWYLVAVKITHGTAANNVDKSLNLRYIVMDSYFSANRTFEVMQIHNFLTKTCMEQNITVDAKFRTTYPSVPIQENLSDCGVCMLLCVDKCFEDDLDPAPHLNWWASEEPDRKRRQLAQTAMSLWEKQKQTAGKA